MGKSTKNQSQLSHLSLKYYVSRSVTIKGIRIAVWSIPFWAIYSAALFIWGTIALKNGTWNGISWFFYLGIVLLSGSLLLEKQNRAGLLFWLGLIPVNVHAPGLSSTRPAKMLTITRYFSYLIITIYLATVTWLPGMKTQESDQSASIDWFMHFLLALPATIGFGELTIRKTRFPLVFAILSTILLIRLIWEWVSQTFNPVIAW